MKQVDLEKELSAYLRRRRKSDGTAYGNRYVKDKLSRFRKIAETIPISMLANVDDDNYRNIIELVIERFEGKEYRHQSYRRLGCGDYLVVIRKLYEMKNKGRKAIRYTTYSGIVLESKFSKG
jgi:hypothetical protein